MIDKRISKSKGKTHKKVRVRDGGGWVGDSPITKKLNLINHNPT